VVARQGPYRLSGEWWDAQKWERTEWDLQFAEGEVYRCRENATGWEIEALYD
jgi:hypothetical protein